MGFNRFEEGGLPEIEYKDIYCAISGVPKPVWRAMQLLHTRTLHTHAGDTRLPVALSNQTALTAVGDSQVQTQSQNRN